MQNGGLSYDGYKGLSPAEVIERRERGLTNEVNITVGKSVKKIVLSNIFTYFNFIFLVITVLLCIVGSFRNLTFLPIVIGNTLVGIVQEIRTKRVLEKMSLLNAPHAVVIRGGERKKVPSSALVRDDIVIFSPGDQICADARVLEGRVLVNESLLTGEENEIPKEAGTVLMSGSFIISGECVAKLENVGEASYISKLAAEAKNLDEDEQSEMIRSINKIVKWMGVILIPIGAVLFYQSYFISGADFSDSIVSMVAAVIGMIPEGLYLLTTAALALGTVRLSGRKVLLNDMKSIESLARVDVLCVDKTGTITEAGMKVYGMFPVNNSVITEDGGLEKALYSYVSASRDNNATMEALREYFREGAGTSENTENTGNSANAGNNRIRASMQNGSALNIGSSGSTVNIEISGNTVNVGNSGSTVNAGSAENTVTPAGSDGKTSERFTNAKTPRGIFPFSSAYKYGAITFDDGTFVLGAPEFVLGNAFGYYRERIETFTKKGYRVLVFAYQNESVAPDGSFFLSEGVRALGFVVLANAVRENAAETFRYFREQGVTVKVISGDSPETVSEISRVAEIEGAEKYADASTMNDRELAEAAEKYTVFGRVSPKQKQLLVRTLQKNGHTVAMTGDGINDILAMRDADCGVAMASGSDAAKQAANVVLLDSDFARMPSVVAEGRRVVNNVQRSASLFLVKNIFSLLLALMSSVLLIVYPLEPTHISLISMFTIGIPGFLLALESNKNRIEGNFLKNVLKKALPAGLTDTLIVGSLVIFGEVFGLQKEDVATSATLVLSVVGFMILYHISMPPNKYRLFVFFANIAGMFLAFTLLPQFFSIVRIPTTDMILTVIFSFAAESVFRIFTWVAERGQRWTLLKINGIKRSIKRREEKNRRKRDEFRGRLENRRNNRKVNKSSRKTDRRRNKK